MSAKDLMRFVTALGVLVVAWALLAVVRRPPSDRLAALSLSKVDTAAVDSVVLTKGKDTVVLVRGAGSTKRWQANGYAADSPSVQGLLKGLADTARSSELVAENRASHERLGVGPDSGLHVLVLSHAHPQLDLMAGKRTSDYNGVYVRRNNEDAVYALRGALVDPLMRAPEDWRDKLVAAVPADSVATIEIRRGAHAYTLDRAGTVWKLASGKAADSAAVATLLNDYHEVHAAGFASRAQLDSVDFKRANTRARLLTKASRPLADLEFDSTAAGIWTRADSAGPVFRLDAYLWGRLTPAESTVVAKPKSAKPKK